MDGLTEGRTTDIPDTEFPTEGEVVNVALLNTVILSIISVLGMFGNTILPFLIIHYPKLRDNSEFLIINLTLGDLIYIRVAFPVFVLHEVFPYWTSSEMLFKQRTMHTITSQWKNKFPHKPCGPISSLKVGHTFSHSFVCLYFSWNFTHFQLKTVKILSGLF